MTQANLIKKIQARDRQCGEKYKWEKDKGEKTKETNKREIKASSCFNSLPILMFPFRIITNQNKKSVGTLPVTRPTF